MEPNPNYYLPNPCKLGVTKSNEDTRPFSSFSQSQPLHLDNEPSSDSLLTHSNPFQHSYLSTDSRQMEKVPSRIHRSQKVKPRKRTDDLSNRNTHSSVFNINKFIEDYKDKVTQSHRRNSESQYEAQQERYIRDLAVGLQEEGSCIPELPQVTTLVLRIHNNWGDLGLVGAKAIEFFSQEGEVMCPLSISPESKAVYNLINGNVLTKSDNEFWLVPFVKPLHLRFVFPSAFRLAMVRIWNYNKTGFTDRGVRSISIWSQELLTQLFSGQIKRATGRLKDYHHTAEYILLTNSSKVLDSIAQKDWLSHFDFSGLEEQQREPAADSHNIYPLQGLYNCQSLIRVEILENFGDLTHTAYEKLRFYDISGNLVKHRAKVNRDKVMTNPPAPIEFNILAPSLIERVLIKCPNNDGGFKTIRILLDTQQELMVTLENTSQEQTFLFNNNIQYHFRTLNNTIRYGKQLKIKLHKNWGGRLISLNKFEVFDVNHTPLLSSRQVPYYVSENLRYLEKAPFSAWDSESPDNCFSAMFSQEKPVQLLIRFQSTVLFGAIMLWNSKQTVEDATKEVEITIDDKIVYQGYLNPNDGFPHVMLLSVEEGVYSYFRQWMRELKLKDFVAFNNEGTLNYMEK